MRAPGVFLPTDEPFLPVGEGDATRLDPVLAESEDFSRSARAFSPFVFPITLQRGNLDDVPRMASVHQSFGRAAGGGTRLLVACCLIATLACGGGGGGGGGDAPSSGGGSTSPPPSSGGGGTTTPPPPVPVATQSATIRFLPSESAGIVGYRLSVATATGRYSGGTQIDIPIASAQDGGSGVLEFAIEVPRNSYSYLAMRAYSASAFSGYSNEIVIPPASSSSGSSAVSVGESDPGPSAPAPSVPNALSSSASPSGSTASGGSAGDSSATSASSDGDEGGAGASSTALRALDFDGAGEYLASSTAYALGATREFSLSVWVLADPRASGRRALISVRGGSDATENRVELIANGAELEMTVHNASGQLVYQATYGSALVAAEWQLVALTFDAEVDASPILFVDGHVLGPASSEFTGHAPVFSDSAGRILIGSTGDAGVGTWYGAIGHVALFDVALGDDEIDELWLRGHSLDLRANLGAYQSTDALLHYWRLGDEPSAVGADFGLASLPIDLDDPAGGIDAADIILDAPALLP